RKLRACRIRYESEPVEHALAAEPLDSAWLEVLEGTLVPEHSLVGLRLAVDPEHHARFAGAHVEDAKGHVLPPRLHTERAEGGDRDRNRGRPRVRYLEALDVVVREKPGGQTPKKTSTERNENARAARLGPPGGHRDRVPPVEPAGAMVHRKTDVIRV